MPKNEKLAAARTAQRLTLDQLAELVADHVQQETGNRPPIDGDHLGRMERGQINWPGAHYRRALRAVLDCRSDADLGFYSTRTTKTAPSPPPPSADGGSALVADAGAATLGVLAPDVVETLGAFLDQPAPAKRLGMVDVADLHSMIDDMEHADHSAGGRTVVRSMALQQLAWATHSAKQASFRDAESRAAWASAVARLGRLAGFMSVDAREHDVARRAFLLSLQVAAQAEDWPSRLHVLSGMCRQAVHLGDADSALKLAQLAKAGDAHSSPTARAVVRVLEARAYGLMGRKEETLRSVYEAESLFEARRPDEDPPWLWYYDDAQFYGDTGQALYPLALAGKDVDAEHRLRRAVDTHLATDTRGRTFSLVKLATIQAKREPDAAALTTAREATKAVQELRSGRAFDYLADLGNALRRSGSDEAAELASEISRTLKSARQT